MAFADYRVALPIAESTPTIDYLWSSFNPHAFPQLSAAIAASAPPAKPQHLTPLTLTRPNPVVNRLPRYPTISLSRKIPLHTPGNLIRRPTFRQLCVNSLISHFERPSGSKPPLLRLALSLLRPVAAQAGITLDLAVNRASVALHDFRDIFPGSLRFQ
jgi:hypothetical protein